MAVSKPWHLAVSCFAERQVTWESVLANTTYRLEVGQIESLMASRSAVCVWRVVDQISIKKEQKSCDKKREWWAHPGAEASGESIDLCLRKLSVEQLWKLLKTLIETLSELTKHQRLISDKLV